MKILLHLLTKVVNKIAVFMCVLSFLFFSHGYEIFLKLDFSRTLLKTQIADAAITEPTELSDLVLWLDGDDATTLYTDTNCSTNVTNGNGVGCWADKSGQNNDVLQSVVANKPVYRLNQQNSLPSLEFVNAASGDDDRLFTSTAGQITANGSFTKLVVYKYDLDGTAIHNLISSEGNGSAFWGSDSQKGKLHLWNIAGGPSSSPGFLSSLVQMTIGQYYIGSVRYDNVASDGTLSILNLDGVEQDTDDTQQNHTSQVISIGSHAATTGLDGNIAEAIVYNRGLADIEIDDVECYLSDKWGIAVNHACPVPDYISLTKTNYPEYKIFQRNGSDNYTFDLSGTYYGVCTSVEASFDGGTYSVIDVAPAGGTFSGDLVGSVGQGDLVVRCANDIAVNDSVSNIGIGDIYVIAGQSNAEGHAQNQQLYTTVAPTAMVFPTVYTDGDVWKVGNDDTDPGGGNGSVWPILGGYIVENTGVPVEFITTADGGKGLVSPAHWTKGGGVDCTKGIPCFDNMVNQVNEAAPNDIKAVLWFQGETDASSGVSRAAYNAALDQLIIDMQTDLPGTPDLIPGIIGPWTPSPVNSTQIRLAIQDAWDDNASVLYGPQSYDVHISSDGVGDDVHYVADDEIQTLAFRWWKSLEDHYYEGAEGRGPVVSSAVLLSSNTQLNVNFTASSALQGCTSTAMWFVDDNGTDRNVATAVLVDSDTVLLTLAAPTTSNNITLTYAKDNTGENQDVVTDSATGNTAAGTSPLPADVFSNYPVTQYEVSIAKTTDGAEPSTDASFTVTVIPTNTSGIAITGNIVYTGTATNGTDYVTGATTFSIANNASTAVITLDTTDDTIAEGVEIIIATIDTPSVGTLGTDNATANLTDETLDGDGASDKKGGSSRIYGCHDKNANNYKRFSISKSSLCEYNDPVFDVTTPVVTSNTGDVLGGGETCEVTTILTQNLKAPAQNGQYHSYAKTIVSEVKLLQAHINRLGLNSGPVDGIIGPITEGAIRRMQVLIGTSADGYVGPLTRALINNSC